MHPKIFILGHGGHGKDEFAALLYSDCPYLIFQSSSHVALEFIYPKLKEKYAYTTPEECFDDRKNHRLEWHKLIKEYNKHDGARLAKLVFSESNIYVGLRDIDEYRECLRQRIGDIFFWVDASERVPTKDPSLSIEYSPLYMRWINNNGTIEHLKEYAHMSAKHIRHKYLASM